MSITCPFCCLCQSPLFCYTFQINPPHVQYYKLIIFITVSMQETRIQYAGSLRCEGRRSTWSTLRCWSKGTPHPLTVTHLHMHRTTRWARVLTHNVQYMRKSGTQWSSGSWHTRACHAKACWRKVQINSFTDTCTYGHLDRGIPKYKRIHVEMKQHGTNIQTHTSEVHTTVQTGSLVAFVLEKLVTHKIYIYRNWT